MMRCPFCNVEITDDAIFCPECGQRVKQPGGSDSWGQSAPDGAGSPGYYGNGDYVPGQAPLASPPTKKKAGKWIGIGAGLAAAAAAAVFAGVRLMAKEPKDVVI
ncbi:MAG: zinc ribbon domain-containing protein, partial [Lachnospiraceae bacterium]|nr:zinc ribbon domain-containing protein [Lachnospiraceae bacterium]